ncbi:MAG: glycosyltransferase family 2 protein [Pseudomonadota bacterium]
MGTTHSKDISFVIPAKNEADGIGQVLNEIQQRFSESEIVVVNDGSTDRTAEIAREYGAIVIDHLYSMGNGAAVKSGARAATGDALVFLDGDGQHNPSDVATLLESFDNGYDMVIGARRPDSHASAPRRWVNNIYNRLASIMTGFDIMDLTSGFRIVDACKFRTFLYLLPNGFSYPTTITMAFLRSGFMVKYDWIDARQRHKQSHSKISPIKDGLRFLLIILKVGSLFSPMRLFFPVSATVMLVGISYYAYTFVQFGRFTNMSALLILSSIIIFLIGIIAEQISALHYHASENHKVQSEKK